MPETECTRLQYNACTHKKNFSSFSKPSIHKGVYDDIRLMHTNLQWTATLFYSINAWNSHKNDYDLLASDAFDVPK